MSSSALQVAKTATYLPDLVEVQRASFKWFLEKGLIEELQNFSPISDYTGKLELHFIGEEYRLKDPGMMLRKLKEEMLHLHLKCM